MCDKALERECDKALEREVIDFLELGTLRYLCGLKMVLSKERKIRNE